MKRNSNPGVAEADSKFSKIIIDRDGKCLNCGSTSILSCSHFHGRSIWATRWDPENCITICIPCHDIWESKKKGVYKDFMLEWLGTDRFYLLEFRAHHWVTSREDSLARAMRFIESNYQNNEIQY